MENDDEFVSVGSEMPRIAHAMVAEGRTLIVTWTTGERVMIDITPIIANHPAFQQLRTDDAYFQKMNIDELGWAVLWPGDGTCSIPTSTLEQYAVSV